MGTEVQAPAPVCEEGGVVPTVEEGEEGRGGEGGVLR